jgi:hypothetical protein
MLSPALVLAAGGTSQVASKGGKVEDRKNWPEGVAKLLNMEFRTDGWNGWFTEWPNDVEHYQLEVKSTDDANAVIAQFAKIKAKSLHVRLSSEKEPSGIGWVSSIKKGNDTAMLFTLGDQERLNAWFARLPGGKFGVMEFAAAPTAVPPTLTIYVANDAIALEKLSIPVEMVVEAGGTPGLFQSSNLKVDPTKEKPKPPVTPTEVDKETRQILDQIDTFIAGRKKPA